MESQKPPKFVFTIDGEIFGEDSEENRAVARRIQACVNACEGLSTEELEQGIIQDMRQAIGQVMPLLQEHQMIREAVLKARTDTKDADAA